MAASGPGAGVDIDEPVGCGMGGTAAIVHERVDSIERCRMAHRYDDLINPSFKTNSKTKLIMRRKADNTSKPDHRIQLIYFSHYNPKYF